MQAPVVTNVTVPALTVHTDVVSEAKVTVNPDDAVALTTNVPEPNWRLSSDAKSIVCAAFATVKLWLTVGAAAYPLSPAWLAWIVQVPDATRVTVAPLTVQTAAVVDVNVTGRPDDAVATMENGAMPNVRLGSASKAMVCAAALIVMANVCVASGATALDAVSCPEKVPAAIGVPLMRPDVLFNARPVGSELATVEYVGAGVPLALTM